jgi:hypothetical protein
VVDAHSELSRDSRRSRPLDIDPDGWEGRSQAAGEAWRFRPIRLSEPDSWGRWIGVGLVAVAVAAILWIWREHGSLILVGVALGALVATHLSVAAPAARPFSSLAETAGPLVLPLLVAVVVGTIRLSPLLQILVSGALLLLAWRLIIVPEAERSGATLRWEFALGRRILKHGGAILVVAIAAALALRQWILPAVQFFKTIGGLAAFLLVLALVVWLAAIALRLLSYATSWLRAFVALFLALALIRLAMAAGFLPWDMGLHEAIPSLQAILVWSAVGLVLLEAALDIADAALLPRLQGTPHRALSVILKVRGGGLPRSVARRAAGLGFSTALAASVVLAASTIYGLVATAQPGHHLATPGGERIHPEFAAVPPVQVRSDLKLAETYSPVLALTDDERWSPIRVDAYIAGDAGRSLDPATLKGPPGTNPDVASLDQLPGSCPGLAPSPCYQLTINCANGHDPCGGGQFREHGGFYRDGAVYVRVLHKGRTPKDGSPNVFADRGPYRAQLSTLIQYWFFYRYDEWEAPAFAGLLTQRHEGDWEAVTIGLSDERPLFVAYSAHCAGSWKPWRDIEVSDQLPRPWVHPLIAVARGSHANYPKADQKRSPDWASCAGVPAGTTTLVSYASNIRDKTEYGWQWYPPPGGWILVDSDTPPMSFPGTWGANDRTTLDNFKSNPIGKEGMGPRTPSLQPLWQRPVLSIFCGGYTPRSCQGE